MPSFRKVNPGDPGPIPHQDWNAAMDAARDFRQRKNKGRGAPRGENASSTIVLVQNDAGSGNDVDRFGILGIDGPLIDPGDNLNEFQNRVALSCVTPNIGASTEDDHEGRFVITLEPIAAGEIGRAVVAGVVQVQVNVTSTSHQWAEIADGDMDKLVSATWGSARMLYAPTGTGVQWMIVRLSERLPDELCGDAES